MDAPQRYPLMPRNEAGKPYEDAAGNLIVVRSEQEENEFYAEHQDAVKVPVFVPLLSLEEQIEALKAQVTERDQQVQAQCTMIAERDQEIVSLKAQVTGMTQLPASSPPQQ